MKNIRLVLIGLLLIGCIEYDLVDDFNGYSTLNTSFEWEDKSIDSLLSKGVGLSQSNPFELLQGDVLNVMIKDTRSDESINSMLTWKVDDTTVIKITGTEIVGTKPGFANLIIETDEVEIGTNNVIGKRELLSLFFSIRNLINITSTKTIFDIGETYQIEVEATDNDDILPVDQYKWTSSMPGVGTINNIGLFITIAPGTTTITANYNEIVSNELKFTVIDPDDTDTILAIIEITSEGDANDLMVGNTLQMNAIGKNSNNSTLADIDFTWLSSNTDLATIDIDGLVTGVAAGDVSIIATSGAITSNAFMLTITPIETSCSSESIGNSIFSHSGYPTTGSVRLYYQEINGVCKLYLELSNDFSSNPPDPAIYLSNTSSRSGALLVSDDGNLNSAAGKSFEVPGNPAIDAYKYAHYYCDAFNIKTGTYEFEN